ncbi:MAG: component of SufBCD complex [Boseongicola sp.]
MDWYETVFSVIDMRSFSNLWYWIALAILWSSVSHWVLGVPFDMIIRARRQKDGDAMNDLHDLVRVNVRRILYIAETAGSWILLFGSAVFTTFLLLAVFYDIEFAQATLLLAAPMGILGALSVRTSRRIQSDGDQGDALVRRLMKHRFVTQMLGVFAIFVTAMFGMYKNLYVGPLGF